MKHFCFHQVKSLNPQSETSVQTRGLTPARFHSTDMCPGAACEAGHVCFHQPVSYCSDWFLRPRGVSHQPGQTGTGSVSKGVSGSCLANIPEQPVPQEGDPARSGAPACDPVPLSKVLNPQSGGSVVSNLWVVDWSWSRGRLVPVLVLI